MRKPCLFFLFLLLIPAIASANQVESKNITGVAVSINRATDSCCVLLGDNDHDGGITISDLTYYVDYLFHGGPAPVCPEEGDINCDCSLDISDLTCFVNWGFIIDDLCVCYRCHDCPNL